MIVESSGKSRSFFNNLHFIYCINMKPKDPVWSNFEELENDNSKDSGIFCKIKYEVFNFPCFNLILFINTSICHLMIF